MPRCGNGEYVTPRPQCQRRRYAPAASFRRIMIAAANTIAIINNAATCGVKRGTDHMVSIKCTSCTQVS